MADRYGAERATAMAEYMARFAAEFEVEISVPPRIPCTRRALAMTEYARDHGALVELRDAIMKAHWADQRDIEDDRVLSELAEQAGLDPAAALAAADSAEYRERLARARQDAYQHEVHGIPTFFFDQFRVVGCQPYSTLRMIAQRQGWPPAPSTDAG